MSEDAGANKIVAGKLRALAMAARKGSTICLLYPDQAEKLADELDPPAAPSITEQLGRRMIERQMNRYGKAVLAEAQVRACEALNEGAEA